MNNTTTTEFVGLDGKTIISIDRNFSGNYSEERLIFNVSEGEDSQTWTMGHCQDCCESVVLEDVIGLTLEEQIGATITNFYKTTSYSGPVNGDEDSQWTFYHLVTNRGATTLRWCGVSNGYYSVDVDFIKL